VVDSVSNYSGGMVDVLSPDKIPENAVSYAENIEFRDGNAKTRRGSRLSREAVSGEEFQGFGVYRKPIDTTFKETMLIAQGGKIYRQEYPFEPVSMTLPETLVATDNVSFIQALNYIYIFRGDDRTVWRWSGDINDEIEDVPEASTLDTMFGAHTGIYAYNRLWTVTGVDQLNVYDSFSEEIDTTNNTIDVTKGDGQKIIKLQDFGKGIIIVLKERSISIVTGANSPDLIDNASDDLQVEFIQGDFGCVAEHSVVPVGSDVFFWSQRGLMTLGLTELNEMQLVDVPLSNNISKLTNRINQAHISKSSAVLFDNYYLIAVPIDHSDEPNAILVYDLLSKSWSGIWRLRDSSGNLYDASTELAIYRFKRLTLYRYNKEIRIHAIGFEGEILHLLSSENDKDFVFNGEYYININATNQYINLDLVSLYTSISGSTGTIEFKIKYDSAATAAIIELVGGSASSVDSLYIHTKSNMLLRATFISNSVAQWDLRIDAALGVGKWYLVSIVQDGTEPSIYIDTKKVDQTFLTAAGNDKTKWITDFSQALNRVSIGSRYTVSALFNIKYLSFQNFDGTLTGSGREALFAHLPLNEGTGITTTASNDSRIIGTLVNSPNWSSPTAESEIESTLITRDMFSNDASNVKVGQGELTLIHHDPKVSASFISPNNNEEIEFTDRTYDETKYDISNHVDYVNTNTNDDHDDPGRKNYSPLTIPVAGITIPVAGITLNKEVERTELLFANVLSSRVRGKIENKQGRIALKNIVLEGVTQKFGNKGFI